MKRKHSKKVYKRWWKIRQIRHLRKWAEENLLIF